jgi:hypothetical protein
MILSLIEGDIDLIGTCMIMNPERLTVVDYGFPLGEHYQAGLSTI